MKSDPVQLYSEAWSSHRQDSGSGLLQQRLSVILPPYNTHTLLSVANGGGGGFREYGNGKIKQENETVERILVGREEQLPGCVGMEMQEE